MAIGRLRLCLSTAALAVLAAPGPASASERPATLMIVFDGSGSMWGRIAGAPLPKFGVAREALRQSLPRLPAGSRVGLAVFGHRRQGDCTDAEVVGGPEPGDPLRFMPQLERLNPRGKGPLTRALREAAGALKATAGEKHLLLIHDDADNCGQDACAAAAEIKAADPAITIHVVSIGLGADDVGRPVCLARTTGGRALPAADAAEASTAVAAVIETIGRGAGAAAPAANRAQGPAPPEPQPAVRPLRPQLQSGAEAPLDTEGPPRLRLMAELSAGAGAVDVPVRWQVRSAGDGAGLTAEATGAMVDLALPGGRYVVTAFDGTRTHTREVDVRAKGITAVAVALDAGLARVSATWRLGGSPSPSALLTVRRKDAGAGAVVAIGRSVINSLVLAPGAYVVRAEDGEATAERELQVQAGTGVELEVPLEAGRLKLAALAREGGPALGEVVYRVLEIDPRAETGMREITRSSAAAPDFVLAAGAYVVEARQGPSELRENIIIRPGEEVARVLSLGLGRVRLKARAAWANEVPAGLAAFRLRRLDKPQGEVIALGETESSLELPAGRYIAEARIGGQNARVEREIEVRAGAETVVELEIAGAEVELRTATAGLAFADMLWEINDGLGRIVWRTMAATPRGILAPGRYAVRIEGRGGSSAAVIEVKAGENRTYEIEPQ